MPVVRIDVQEGKSTAYKRSILHGVRRAITFVLGVGEERIMQRLIETPGEDIDVSGGRTDSFTIVEIVMLSGREPELKLKLYEAIVRELRFSPGIVARDIVVYVIDPPADSWCIAGEVPGSKAVADAHEDAAAEAADDDGPESSKLSAAAADDTMSPT